MGLILTIIFYLYISYQIKRKWKLSLVGWGIALGLTGAGILWVVLAHVGINKLLEKFKNSRSKADRNYYEHAQLELHDFTIAYAICLLIAIILIGLYFYATYYPYLSS